MKKITRVILVGLVVFVLLATSASAVTYSDADGDGICEPGEEITFEGDYSYIDDQGNEHLYHSWYWDMDGDGDYEKSGRVVTHTFATEGVYKVTLYEVNADGKIVEIDIEVKSEPDQNPSPNPNPGQDDDWAKYKDIIKRIIKRCRGFRFKFRLLMKIMIRYLCKKYDLDLDDVEIDNLKDYVKDLINNRPKWHRRCRRRCKWYNS